MVVSPGLTGQLYTQNLFGCGVAGFVASTETGDTYAYMQHDSPFDDQMETAADRLDKVATYLQDLSVVRLSGFIYVPHIRQSIVHTLLKKPPILSYPEHTAQLKEALANVSQNIAIDTYTYPRDPYARRKNGHNTTVTLQNTGRNQKGIVSTSAHHRKIIVLA